MKYGIHTSAVRACLFLSTAIVSCSGSLALAQETPPAQSDPAPTDDDVGSSETDASPSEDIVVTATGRSQAASSVPYNVTAQSEAELREGNVTDIKRLIALSPSINAPLNGARFADSVTVRGLNVSPVNANNIEQFARTTLDFYLNDTPLPNIAYRIKDIARVETLLGPQGTLYGGGSLGGTIRYITNQPEFDAVSARVSTSLFAAKGGSFSHDTDAMINLPLSSSLAVRATIARLDDSGYVDRISNPSWRSGALAWTTLPDPTRNRYENDDYNRVTSGRIALAWKVNDDAKITLAHAEQDQLAHGTTATSVLPLAVANATSPDDIVSYISDPNFSPCTTDCQFTGEFETPFLAGRDVIVSRYPEFARRKFRLSSADLDIDLGFANLHSSTSLFKDTRIGQADYAGPGWTFYFSFGDAGAAFDSDRSAYILFDNSYKGFNHETRLTSTHDGPFSWIAGLYYTDTERSLKFSEYLPGLDAYNGVNRATSGGNVDEGYRENLTSQYEEIAAYGELGYAITPRWNVTVGGRVFNYKDRALSQIRDYSFDLVNNSVDVTREAKGQSYFKFNTSYDVTDDALVYATVSQGFRRGGTNGFRNVGAQVVNPDVQAFRPDSTVNYELGFKGYVLDRTLFLQADVYQIDWRDVQTYYSQDINGFPVNGTANGPNARSRGIEAAARLELRNGLDMRFSTAFTEAKWAESRTLCLYTDGTACRTWTEGGLLGGSPRWKHSGDIRYTRELAYDVRGFVSLTGRYVGAVQIDRADNPSITVDDYPPYALFDLRAGFTWRDIDVTLWVENVLDRRAQVSQQFDRVLGGRIFYTQPRTVGLNLSYAFR